MLCSAAKRLFLDGKSHQSDDGVIYAPPTPTAAAAAVARAAANEIGGSRRWNRYK